MLLAGGPQFVLTVQALRMKGVRVFDFSLNPKKDKRRCCPCCGWLCLRGEVRTCPACGHTVHAQEKRVIVVARDQAVVQSPEPGSG